MAAVKTREQVIEALVAGGVRRDSAALYAEAYTEYHQAAAHIAEHGAIVQHPRTGTPMENPYLPVRDRAAKRLTVLGAVVARAGAVLW